MLNELLTTSGTNEPAPNAMRAAEVLTRFMPDVAGGNPHVVRSLVAKARALSAEGMLEELARDPDDSRVIEPSHLPEIEAQLDLAARARELSASATSLLQAGNVRNARAPSRARSNRAPGCPRCVSEPVRSSSVGA
jgi:hypothetical protein